VSQPLRDRPALDGGTLPGAGELCDLASREGIDAATTRLYESILASPVHGPFIRRVDEIGRRPATAGWSRNATLAVVPAASYRENPGSGADGRLFREQAEKLGCPTEIVPIASTGSVEENSAILLDWLERRRGRTTVLASLSKGGADVKVALAKPRAVDAFAGVAAWISLCGILEGTPVADWLLSRSPDAVLLRLYFRLHRQGIAFLRDLRYGAGQPLAGALTLPAHVRMINIVGFPLREHLASGVSRRCHRRLTPLGPNDGALVLADVCRKPGVVYPIWGADHYLRPAADVKALVLAILQYLDESLDGKDGGD
jgi:hypothetical protein